MKAQPLNVHIVDEEGSKPSRGRFGLLLVCMALDVVIVSIGYALGRSSRPGGMALFVVGQLLVCLLPAVFVLENPGLSHAKGIGISVAIGTASFAISQSYSPIHFIFTDEFQHLLTAQNILATHHLFGYNPALQISPQFPGMEIVAASLTSLTHLSLYATGTIVAGASHILTSVLLYLLAREFGLTERASALAVVIFSIGIEYEFFLSDFAYETFAVTFLLATCVLTLRATKSSTLQQSIPLVAGAALCAFITVASHHITSFFLWLILAVLLASFTFSKERASSRYRNLLAIFGITSIALVLWDTTVGHSTLRYLSQLRGEVFPSAAPSTAAITQSVHQQLASPIGQSVVHYVTGGNGKAPTGLSPTLWRILSDSSSLFIGALVLLALWMVGRSALRSQPGIRAMAFLCFPYFALAPVFLYSTSGTALVARGQVFALIPVGIVVGQFVEGQLQTRTPLKFGLPRSTRVFAYVFSVLVVVVGGVTNAQPNYAEKLPGPYNVAAGLRSSDPRTVASAQWMGRVLGPRQFIAADHDESLLFEAVAGAHVPFTSGYQIGVASLIESDGFTHLGAKIVQALNLRYVVADYRLTSYLPADGENFVSDPLFDRYRRPLPRVTLSKFNSIAGVSRTFDDGQIVLYDLQTSLYDYG